MSVYAHNDGSRLITGMIPQLLQVLSGNALVVKKGQREGQDSTDYLMESAANAAHLRKGLAEFEQGNGKVHALK